MKRLHVHVAVRNLDASIRFYSQLFAAEPAVRKPDYAKWMLEDPRAEQGAADQSAMGVTGGQPVLAGRGLKAQARRAQVGQ